MLQQDYIFQPIRAAAILTTGFVSGESDLTPFNVNPALRNQVNLLIDFTIGSLTSLNIKVQYSNDGTTWYDETFQTITAGTAAMSLGLYNFTATGKYVLSIPVKNSYIRFQAQGVGTVTSSSLTLGAVVGTV